MPKTKKTLKHALWVIMAIMGVALAIVSVCEISVYSASKERVYSDVEKIPHREVGLLLGTNPKGRRGGAQWETNTKRKVMTDIISETIPLERQHAS